MVFAITAIAVTRPAGAGPVPTGAHAACASCHSASASAPERGAAATVDLHRSSRTDGSAPARCESCHDLQRTAVPSSIPNAHGKFECLACHDPHVNDVPFHFARAVIEASAASADFDPETRLCVSCHFSSADFHGRGGGFIRHPVGVAAPRHDERVVSTGAEVACVDPSDPPSQVRLPLMNIQAPHGGHRAVIGCGTCHSLHASLHPLQLRWAPQQEPSVCMSCHMGITDEPAIDASNEPH